MTKDEEIMQYLHEQVFNPILSSNNASKELKQGVRLTIIRLNELDVKGKVKYYWSAIVGTENSTKFAKLMKMEKFTRFEEIIDDFRDKFNDEWLRK